MSNVVVDVLNMRLKTLQGVFVFWRDCRIYRDRVRRPVSEFNVFTHGEVSSISVDGEDYKLNRTVSLLANDTLCVTWVSI